MTLNQLQNLVKVKQLKPEPPDQVEFCNLVSSAKRQLQDARVEGLSIEGHLEVAPQLFQDLVSITEDLLQKVEALGPVA